MGPQSQRRLTLQERTHQLQGNSRNNKRKAGQLTLFGDRAFQPESDCVVCKGKLGGRTVHRAHHKLCPNNRRTQGVVSQVTLQQNKIDKDLRKHFQTPLAPSEKASSKHTNKEAVQAFFTKRMLTNVTTTPATTTTTEGSAETAETLNNMDGNDFCREVTAIINTPTFREDQSKSRAPLAMVALASVVVEKVIRMKQTSEYFDGLTFTVPGSKDMYSSPHYHSIVGQQLLLVDWIKLYGLDIKCPGCQRANLLNDRTNYSKNKVLFPIFNLHGAPSWCMVMSMTCPCCRRRYASNDGAILVQIPQYAALAYPVESKYALPNKNCHLGRSVTDILDMLMPTYGNGDLCSRLLYDAINRAYLRSAASYYSYNGKRIEKHQEYVKKNGEYIRAFPPLGDGIRDVYDEAANSNNTPWGVSDYQRHTREIQGVRCSRLYAEDHTHEVTKNYYRRRQIGAVALWDVATETGEIATAALVPSTKTKDLSHAAISLSKRPHFKPKAMYSDRWPIKVEYWEKVFGNKLEGRLGLFHFMQRLTKTMRKRHIDYFLAINQLLDSVYYYNQNDYEALLIALKDGTLTGKKHTDEDIADLKSTKYFRQRHSKCLRKEIRQPNVMCVRLDQWFERFKCAASEGSPPALGRFDPVSGDSLFTTETKPTLLNCKEKCIHLQDPLPIEEMYDVIMPNPNSPHGLKQYLSRRGESNLESFHLTLAHFGNTGMRESLADNLNLTGTARYNLQMRHRLRISRMTDENTRTVTPAGWETIPPHYNHSELEHVNKLAQQAGIVGMTRLPFPEVEPLLMDNGERFFSEYLSWMKEENPQQSPDDLCLCSTCTGTETNEQTMKERPERFRVDGPSNVLAEQQQQTRLQHEGTQNKITNVVSPPGAMPIPAYAHQSPGQWFTVQSPPMLWINPYTWYRCQIGTIAAENTNNTVADWTGGDDPRMMMDVLSK